IEALAEVSQASRQRPVPFADLTQQMLRFVIKQLKLAQQAEQGRALRKRGRPISCRSVDQLIIQRQPIPELVETGMHIGGNIWLHDIRPCWFTEAGFSVTCAAEQPFIGIAPQVAATPCSDPYRFLSGCAIRGPSVAIISSPSFHSSPCLA